MAEFKRKYTKEIYDNFIAEYNSLRQKYADDDTSPVLPKSVVKSLGYAFAAEISTLWGMATWTLKQCFPQSADLPALKLWGGLVGVDYKNGQSANLTIRLENVTAQYLEVGAVYKDLTTGLVFQTTSRVNAKDGVITANVKCLKGGNVGNLPAGTILTLTTNYEGIPPTATVESIAVTGSDDEGKEVYRKRVLARYKSKPRGGTVVDYYNWAMETAGLVDCLPYVLEEGKLTMYLVADGTANGRTPTGNVIPNPFPEYDNGQITPLTGSGQFLNAAQKIEGDETIGYRRLLNTKVELKPPVYTPVTVAITGLTGNEDGQFNAAIKSAIIENLDAKRPNILALGYDKTNATVNKYSLIGLVTSAIDGNLFTGLSLKDGKNEEADEIVLGIGELCYLRELTINGTVVK